MYDRKRKIDPSIEFAVLDNDEVMRKEAAKQKRGTWNCDNTWSKKWARFCEHVAETDSLDMSTLEKKRAVVSRLKRYLHFNMSCIIIVIMIVNQPCPNPNFVHPRFFQSIRKVTASSPGARADEIYYPPKTYANIFWAISRLYNRQYKGLYKDVEEALRPPKIKWGEDEDLQQDLGEVITVEMEMASKELGESIHDNEVETLPTNVVPALKAKGLFAVTYGEAINNCLLWICMNYHGVRGYKSLHQLVYPASFTIAFDGIVHEEYCKLSKWQANKTFKPSVKQPSADREMPPAFALPNDPTLCGVFLLKHLHKVRPKLIKSNPTKKVCHPNPN